MSHYTADRHYSDALQLMLSDSPEKAAAAWRRFLELAPDRWVHMRPVRWSTSVTVRQR